MLDDTLPSWYTLAEAADRHAGVPGHSERVAAYAAGIVEALGLSEAEIRPILVAAQVHDLGMLGVPTAILAKSTPLTAEEWARIRTHPQRSADLVPADRTWETVRSLVLHHHERLDGSGYPHNLTGESIPLGARVIAVAECFDAMITARPFAPPLLVATAMMLLRRQAGKGLDRTIVALFLERALPVLTAQPEPGQWNEPRRPFQDERRPRQSIA
jgi:cyclic di-GMP phosphodiesterase